MKEIILTFKKGQPVRKEVNGYSDNSCIKDTDFLDLAIGQVVDIERKPEFYLPQPDNLSVENKIVL
jgi:hypothetical protein